MTIQIIDNYGHPLEVRQVNSLPTIDHHIQLKSVWYKVWRVFHYEDGAIVVQLGQRLSSSSLSRM